MRNQRGGLIGPSVKMHIAPSGGATAAAECRARGREERTEDPEGITGENFLLSLRRAHRRSVPVDIGRETHRQGQRIKLKCVT